MNRTILAAVAGVCALAGGAGVALTMRGHSATEPQIGGPFTLADGAGHQVSDKSFSGHWRLVYFGYTHCPDACPTTLGDLGAALDKLPPAARARVQVLFITVDPARDTPAVIGGYVRAFGPEFVGLTGTPAQLAAVEASYHVYARRRNLAGGDYAMDHSSIIYVMRPDGHFAGLLDDGMSPADLAKHLSEFGV